MNILPAYMYIPCAHRVQKAMSNPLGLELWVLLAATWVWELDLFKSSKCP